MSSTNRNVVLALAALAAAITGFILLNPGSDDSSSSSTTTAVTTTTTGAGGKTTTTTVTSVPDATVIHLVGGKPTGGKQKIVVNKGDVVRLNVTSDDQEQIHVHGFDIEKEVSPGSPAQFKFTADIEGRFEVESHTTDTQIAEITVNP
jgi:hypothetical protein